VPLHTRSASFAITVPRLIRSSYTLEAVKIALACRCPALTA
jgi:hypothetical protein